MTHGEKSALGFLGLITLAIWVSGRIEKHEQIAMVRKKIEMRDEAQYGKKKK